jgi:hypothetical protein
MRRLRPPSVATVLSAIALAVSLGGTGYAAIAILPANSVGTPQLKRNAVISSKVRNHSLLRVDFRAGQLPAGPQGPQGPAGPTGATGPTGPSDAFSGFKNGPVSIPDTLGTIASLPIAGAGKYVVVGKAWLFNLQNANVLVLCRLVAGTDFDESRTSLEGNNVNFVSGASVAFNVVHEFTAAGAVDLQCNDFGVNTEANFIKITAIRVGNLTNTALP